VNARPSGLPSRSPSRHASRSAAAPPPGGRSSSVTQEIEATIRTYFEVTEVGAGFGQYLVGKPDCESNEPVAPFFYWPPRAVRQRTAADQAPRPRISRAEFNESRRLLRKRCKCWSSGRMRRSASNELSHLALLVNCGRRPSRQSDGGARQALVAAVRGLAASHGARPSEWNSPPWRAPRRTR
jgi:hypothetical protein